MGSRLNSGEVFPSLSLNLIDGRTLRIPEDTSGRYLVALFYRGHW